MVSPFGNYVLLASLALGSADETQQQLCNALSVKNIDEAFLLKLKNQDDTLNSRSELWLLNTIWLQKECQLNATYVDRLKQALRGDIREIDFNSPETITKINSWVDVETNGLLTKLFDTLSADARLILSNIIVFKGDWKNAFDSSLTKQGEFNNLDGSKSAVEMMTQKNDYRYYEGTNYQWLEMPYRNDTFSMIVLLPNSDQTFADFEKDWKPVLLENGDKNAEMKTINVSFPKFSVSMDYDLVPALQSMGIDFIFTSLANFKPMIESNDVMVSQVRQSLVLKVDEKGTQAAAVTAAEVLPKSVPQETFFNVDRPFFFLIRENQTGTILFMGRIINM